MKKILGILLSICLVIMALPLMAVAEDELDFSALNQSIAAAEKLDEKIYFNFLPVKRALKAAKDFVRISSLASNEKISGVSDYFGSTFSGPVTQAHINALNSEINRTVSALVNKMPNETSYNGASVFGAGVFQSSLVLKLYNLTEGSTFGWYQNDMKQICVGNLVYQSTSQYDNTRWNASTAKIVVDCDEISDIFQSGVRIGLTLPCVYSNLGKARWGVQLFPYADARSDGALSNAFYTTTVKSKNGHNITYTLCDSSQQTKLSAETSGGDFNVDATLPVNGGAYGEYSWRIKGQVPKAGDSVVVRVVGICASWAYDQNLQELTEWTDLTITSVSKTALRNAVNTAVYAEENYTEDSYAKYKTALANAETVLNSKTAEQNEIDTACTNLRNAINALKTNLNFSNLNDTVKTAESNINNNYKNTEFVSVALFNSLHTAFTSQQQIDSFADNLNYLCNKSFGVSTDEKKTASHKQIVNYANIMNSTINMTAVNADSATSSNFTTSDDIGSMVCTVNQSFNAVNNILTTERCYQYNENTSTAVYNLDRTKYSDLSQLGNIIYSGIITNAATHQHSLCLCNNSELKCYSETSKTVTGQKTGKAYTYSLTGGGFSTGTASDWNYSSGIVATEHRAGLKGALPDAGDSVVLRVMTRTSVSGYDVNLVWSYYGWIDIVINSYDPTSLLLAINSYVNPDAGYTSESYTAYTKALADAIATAQESTTQQEYDLAEQTLRNAIAQLKKSDDPDKENCKYISATQNEKDKVYFYVPELIFLNTDTSSYRSQGSYLHKSYLNYSFDYDTKTAALELDLSNKGALYFYRENATDVTLSFRYLNTDFLPMKAFMNSYETTETENYVNAENNIAFYGTTRVLRPSNTTKINSSKYYTVTSDRLTLTLSSDSVSPSLIAHSTGCYIEWTVTYTDPDTGAQRSVISYSYIHKLSLSSDEIALLSRVCEPDRAMLREAQNRVLSKHDELGMQAGYQSSFCSTDSPQWQHFIALEKAAGDLLSRSNTLSYVTVNNEVYTCGSLAHALEKALNEALATKKTSSVKAKYLELRQDELGRNFLYELTESENHNTVAQDSMSCSYGDNLIIAPPEILGYEKIGFLRTTQYSADNEIDSSVLKNLQSFDGRIEEKRVDSPSLEFTVLYKASKFSSVVNTANGNFNYLRLRTSGLPENLGGIGYPSYSANPNIETDISYTIENNNITVWTDGPTKSEKYQYIPFYAELEKNTEYVLTYNVVGASQDSVQFTAYSDSFLNGNSFTSDTYFFEQSGSDISTGSDTGTAYFRIELLGNSRNGQHVEIKNLCLSKATDNELYLETSTQYPQKFTASKTDKMGMSYTVTDNNGFTAVSQYNSLMYTQRQLLPFYVVLKPGVNYSLEYNVSGLDKSKVILSLYNPEFSNATDGNGKYYTPDVYGNFTSSDDGLAQLRIQYVDGIDKDVAVTVSNIKVTNLDSKTVLSGTYNQTVSLGIPVKEYYRFTGWQLKSNGDGTIYGTLDTVNNTYKFGAGTDLIEATWELDVTPGDVNLDGKADGMDAVIIRCIISGMLKDSDLKKIQYTVADVNSDGQINGEDVSLTEESGLFN